MTGLNGREALSRRVGAKILGMLNNACNRQQREVIEKTNLLHTSVLVQGHVIEHVLCTPRLSGEGNQNCRRRSASHSITFE